MASKLELIQIGNFIQMKSIKDLHEALKLNIHLVYKFFCNGKVKTEN